MFNIFKALCVWLINQVRKVVIIIGPSKKKRILRWESLIEQVSLKKTSKGTKGISATDVQRKHVPNKWTPRTKTIIIMRFGFVNMAVEWNDVMAQNTVILHLSLAVWIQRLFERLCI